MTDTIKAFFCSGNREKMSQLLYLQERIGQYYLTNTLYPAFESETHKPEFWEPIKASIDDRLKNAEKCTVLEFGAGKTGFAQFLGDVREKIDFDVQDVTGLNAKYLNTIADQVYISPLTSINRQYDVIFSTFVWEHIYNPEATLKHLLSILNPGGSLFLICPRYDFPFYLSNSAMHLPWKQKILTGLWLSWQRIKTLLFRRPAFIIHLDPAVFHVPFHRDVDAVHWVSFFDLQYSLPENFSIRKIFSREQKTLKGRFWERFLLLNVQITKDKE